MNDLKRHLSVANVLSCLALFMALSGAAYAATLGKNAVKTKNIANGAVTGPKLKNASVVSAKLANGAVITARLANGAVINGKIANGAVTSGKLANGAISSGKLADNAVTAAKIGGGAVTEGKLASNAVSSSKLAAEAVATGKLGKESVTAEKLAVGLYGQLVKNVTYENKASALDSVDAKSVTANCPAGKEAIGGGARVNGELKEVAITGSVPQVVSNKRTGWTAEARESTETASNWSVEAFVVCAEL